MSTRGRAEANVGAGNWKGHGMWAWILFRISGLVVAGYLFVHIIVISEARMSSSAALDDTFRLFRQPHFVLLDLLLVGAVLFHAFNGVRVLVMDLGVSTRRHKAVFAVVMTLAVVTLAFFIVKVLQVLGQW